jgi:hypothetical protein
MYEMWLVQELADKNTLADALQAGWFDQPAPHGRNHVRRRRRCHVATSSGIRSQAVLQPSAHLPGPWL